jgi:CRP/FNR family transcriptional regulator, cyclic AMP receptor protein
MARVTQDAKIQLLRRAPLFAELSKKELVDVARLSDDLEAPAGAVLAREGEIGREFFVVVEGEVEFTRGGRTLDVSGPVDFFGEVSLVEHTRRLATVTATTPLRFFVLGSREFRTLMDDNPRIERKVLLALARRLLTLVEAERHPTLA